MCDVIKYRFSMELALITTLGLQFDEISIFQHLFPKRSNSLVISPLHFFVDFLMFMPLIHEILLSLESPLMISDG